MNKNSNLGIFLISFLLICFLILFFINLFFFQRKGETIFKNAEISGFDFQIEIAQTIQERFNGLSEREEIQENQGMLFIFKKSGYYSFCMRKMKFDLDIIWFDENFKVVEITDNVSHNSFPKIFKSLNPIKYVLEVKAGWGERHQIKEGDHLIIKS